MLGNYTRPRVNREDSLREENSFLRKQAQQARRDGALAAYDTVLAYLDNPPESTTLPNSVTLANTIKERVRTLRASVAETI